MSRALRYAAIGIVAAVAAAAGYLTRQATTPAGAPIAAPSQAGADALLKVTLPDLDGAPQTLEQWRGKVMVVNFWATWCPPCLKEIPDFASVSEQFAAEPVQFVGIGIDNPARIAEFQREHKVPYPLLLGSTETLALAADIAGASQAMPLTYIFDRSGAVHRIKLGVLNRDELEGTIRALLAP